MLGAEADPIQPAPSRAGPVMSLALPETLGSAAVARLLAELEAVPEESVRVLLLRGAPHAFCRGMDLSEISSGAEADSRALSERATLDFTRVISKLQATSVITVAVVEGPALGGGVGLAAACDFVVASDTATFALPELLLGLVPAIILPVLADRLGLRPATRWAMTKASWKADEAKTAGLVDQLVSPERLDVELQRLIRQLLSSHRRGVVTLKQLVRELPELDAARAIERGRTTLNGLLGQAKVREELAAFSEYGLLPGEADA